MYFDLKYVFHTDLQTPVLTQIGNKGNNKITELRTILQTHNYINRQNQSTTGKL